jgi:molybdopterin-guanine dinucleotide biosynthesis adapter protein
MKINELPQYLSVIETANGSPSPLCAGRRVFGFAGTSGHGKTTLVEEVVAHLIVDGYRVSALKHVHDGFDMDQPGKDSYRMREAGCKEVMLVSDKRWALMRELGSDPEPSLDALVSQMGPVDIVLVEGFRASQIPKIEVFRPSLGKAPRWPGDQTIVAVATDESLDIPLQVLDMNDTMRVAAFVRHHVGL